VFSGEHCYFFTTPEKPKDVETNSSKFGRTFKKNFVFSDEDFDFFDLRFDVESTSTLSHWERDPILYHFDRLLAISEFPRLSRAV